MTKKVSSGFDPKKENFFVLPRGWKIKLNYPEGEIFHMKLLSFLALGKKLNWLNPSQFNFFRKNIFLKKNMNGQQLMANLG